MTPPSCWQDLVNKFYSLVMPEVSKSIVKDDPTFIEMLDNIADIKLSMFPELSLPDGLRKLHEQLRQCALKNVPADLTTTAAVEDLKIKLSSIMFSTDSEEGEDSGNVLQLTQGQVILNGLSGLFETIEKCTLNMLDNVENITVPDEWRVVDLIKQTKEVMCTTAGLFLKEDLLFVRKVSSIVDFCAECKNFMKAFKLEHNTHEGEYLDLVSPPGTPSRRSSSVPVPTDHQFSHPIRRYISETLVCHVLGQPSYSLTALLVSTITQYLDVPVHFNKPITIEDLCKIANDHCQTVLSLGVIQNARNLFSLHDIAWREWDKARRLTTNLENCKQSIQRLKNVTMRFQWLHEESLIVPDSVHAWVGHQRSALLTTIKKVLSEQLATSINNVIEKIHSQQFRISQRLQWAAGANSALNTIIDEFQRICNHHKSMLEKEEAIFNDMEEIAKAIIHLESSHTRIPAQTSSDRETIQILQRCGDVTLKLKLCAEELSQLSDIMPHLQLPCDGSPLNKEWIQRRLDEASNERNKLQNDKKFANNKVVKNKENVLSELEKLRSLNRQHRKLLVEVWQQLTALAKLEEPPPSGQLQPGPRAFINHQNKFGEETKGYIQSTQDLIASDMSLTSKPSWTSKARAEEFRQLGAMAATLRSLAEWYTHYPLSIYVFDFDTGF
jgi:PI-3-kinase-related kinase SMG-1